MDDAISRSKLIEFVKHRYHDIVAGSYPYNIVAYDMVRITENAPALDVVPVVHARWMIHYYNLDSYSYKDVPYDETTFDNPCGLMFCSHCDKEALLNGAEEYAPSRYCPHCGARMDGEVE